MDAIYSLSLLLALVAGGAGAAIFALVATRPDQARKLAPGLALGALVCSAIALLSGIISVLVHLLFGHGPDSVAPMTTWQFLSHHKAFWFVLLFILLAFGAWRAIGRYHKS